MKSQPMREARTVAMEIKGDQNVGTLRAGFHPFRRAVLRGLGIVLPPLLTIVIFLWIGSTVQLYVLEPVSAGARNAVAWYLEGQVPEDLGSLKRPVSDASRSTELEDSETPADDDPAVVRGGKSTGGLRTAATRASREVFMYPPTGVVYVQTSANRYVPEDIYGVVHDAIGSDIDRMNAKAIFRQYVEIDVLPAKFLFPLLLSLFVLALYLLGKFLAAGIGRVLWNVFERGIHRLPLVRNVYGSVKQVTDFMFSDTEIEYTRVVAIEYPRKGVWSLGLVTGESMVDIHTAAGEPVVSLLIPSSPMPVTGYTITVRKSETVDLNITIDQAFQFIVSCGVVVPPRQFQGESGSLPPSALPGASNPTLPGDPPPFGSTSQPIENA